MKKVGICILPPPPRSGRREKSWNMYSTAEDGRQENKVFSLSHKEKAKTARRGWKAPCSNSTRNAFELRAAAFHPRLAVLAFSFGWVALVMRPGYFSLVGRWDALAHFAGSEGTGAALSENAPAHERRAPCPRPSDERPARARATSALPAPERRAPCPRPSRCVPSACSGK